MCELLNKRNEASSCGVIEFGFWTAESRERVKDY